MSNTESRSGEGNHQPDRGLASRRRDRSDPVPLRLSVLAGLNLAEVADNAGVNRGLIYTYFGSRQQLLRAAIERIGWEGLVRTTFAKKFSHLPFARRHTAVFRESLVEPRPSRLLALLVLDNDHSARIFPSIEDTKTQLQRDVAMGHLPRDSDPVVAHAMTAVLYLGYGLYREQIARELGISLEDLDERAISVDERMAVGIARR